MEDDTTDRVQVPKGTYPTPEAFAYALNDSLATKKVHVEYEANAMRYAMHFDTSEIKYVAMSRQMYYVLGFRPAQKVRDGDVAEHPPDIQGGISHLAIYTNIIQPVVVGDCMSQMLRIVSVTGKHGDNVERIFDSPLYCNLSSRDVSKIFIDIRTLDNQPVLFSTGNVICTLLFRKISLI